MFSVGVGPQLVAELAEVGLLKLVKLDALLVGLEAASVVVVVIVDVEVGAAAAVHDQSCDLNQKETS